MLQILGYILLIGIAIAVLKFGFAVALRLTLYGIVAFFCVGAVTGALTILGVMESDTSWTITKWAFFIGVLFSVKELFTNPRDFGRDVMDIYNDHSGSHSSPSSSSNSDKDNGYDPPYGCCDNCRWNMNRGSHYSRCAQDGRDDRVANERCGSWMHY